MSREVEVGPYHFSRAGEDKAAAAAGAYVISCAITITDGTIHLNTTTFFLKLDLKSFIS